MGGVISEGHARALASLNNPSDCIAVYKEVLKSHATVRETEELVREKKQNQKSKIDINQEQAKKIKDFLEKLLGVEINEIEASPKVNKLILKIFLNS
jgi:ParB family chromosome partitioning protein